MTGVAGASYHNEVVVKLQAVEHPGGRREEGGHGQGEGQALDVPGTNHSHL